MTSSWRWSCASGCRRPRWRSRRHQRLNCAASPRRRRRPTPSPTAIRNNDDKALTAILGSTWHEFAPGSDRDDDEIRAAFLKAWDENHTIIPEGPDKALFGAGTTGWVAPIPIVKQGNEWRFDVEAGKKEMQARLIGRNELAVIQTLLAIVDAQRDYAALDPMKVGASGLCPATAEQSRSQGRAVLGEQAGRAGKPARARWSPRRSPARSRSTATTAIASACSTARARMRRAAPTTIWSTAACWAASPSSPGRCAGARPA